LIYVCAQTGGELFPGNDDRRFARRLGKLRLWAIQELPCSPNSRPWPAAAEASSVANGLAVEVKWSTISSHILGADGVGRANRAKA
jgi:hypothetical protein